LDPREKERLRAELRRMTQNERQKVLKRAAKLRRDAGPRKKETRRKRDWSDEGDDEPDERRRPSSGTLEDWALEVLARDLASGATPPEPGTTTARRGLVLGVGPQQCEVLAEGERLTCRLSPRVRERDGALAAGDEVLLDGPEDAPQVVAVLPRRTTLARPDPHYPVRERVLVANVDVVGVVAALRRPPLQPGLIDRFLVAIERGGAQPLLVVNKVDLCVSEADLASELQCLAPYQQAGVPVVACSAATGLGIDQLHEHLKGRVAAFVGKSGTGKTSLLNALVPGLDARVGEVRASDGKGRHTTTAAVLHELPGGGRILDTPGIRAFGLERLSASELVQWFPDLGSWAGGCRYRDCTHDHEPDCEVRRAVADGHVSEARWRAWLRILGASP
jgi:ribosome biogenesis GTPase